MAQVRSFRLPAFIALRGGRVHVAARALRQRKGGLAFLDGIAVLQCNTSHAYSAVLLSGSAQASLTADRIVPTQRDKNQKQANDAVGCCRMHAALMAPHRLRSVPHVSTLGPSPSILLLLKNRPVASRSACEAQHDARGNGGSQCRRRRQAGVVQKGAPYFIILRVCLPGYATGHFD